MWHCRSFPAGPIRQEMVAICAAHKLAYRDIMVWPLLGGQAVTAGVIGFVRRFRYVLVTPLLVQALTLGELEAVLAHEIGHVVVENYFTISPPQRIHEVLAQFAERHVTD